MIRVRRMSATRSAVLVRPSRARSARRPLTASFMPPVNRRNISETTQNPPWGLKDCGTILYDVGSVTPLRFCCEVRMSTPQPETSADLEKCEIEKSDIVISENGGDAPMRFGAWRHLPAAGRRAFVGAFGGYGLDAFDYQVLPLTLAAITVYFRISAGEAGLLNAVTLVEYAIGGLLAGILADRLGRTT